MKFPSHFLFLRRTYIMAFKGYDFIDEATLEMMGNTLTEQIDFLLQQEVQPNEDDARIAARIFLETIQKSFQVWEEAERHASEIRKYSKAIEDLKTYQEECKEILQSLVLELIITK